MKRPLFLLALLACGASLLQAADLYDITLSNAKRYTQCRILYEAGGVTKFTGRDRKGNSVTMEVKSSSILDKRESAAPKEEEPTPEPTIEPTTEPTETPADTATEPAAPAENATPAEGDNAAAPAADAEKTEEAPAAPAVSDEEAAKVKDITLRLREKLARVDSGLAELTNPSRSLTGLCENRKRALTGQLAKLDKMAIEVAELQTKYNTIKGADYVFTHVTSDDRTKYERDGQAAYQAMLTDVKQYKNARKVGGLDKFEIMRDRYQGIPEYKEAYKWYMSTLNDLSRRWNNLLKKETAKRSKLNAAKKSDMDDRDQKAYDKLEKQFAAENEQIAKVWYNPDNRNLVMLRHATNKVRDALRRNEKGLQDPKIGTVPTLLAKYWEANDQARALMINGDFEGAKAVLDKDEAYKQILRLNQQLLPEEYKTPLREQRQDLQQTINQRSRERRTLESTLERKISALEQATSSAEAQIDDMLERISKEREIDTQASSIELDEKKPEPAAATPEKKGPTVDNAKQALKK